MKKTLSTLTFILCFFGNLSFPQKSKKPFLAGTWAKGAGNGDFEEFIYHRYASFLTEYSQEHPGSRMVVRLCSEDTMAAALAQSDGFAYQLPRNAEYLDASTDGLFYARWSKCSDRSEQYWYVPENSRLEYDELIAVDLVETKRFPATDVDQPNRAAADKQYADYLGKFIAELKNNPQAEGFIIRNLKMNDRKFKEALKQMQAEKIAPGRYRVVSKRMYDNYYPEFLTVWIRKEE